MAILYCAPPSLGWLPFYEQHLDHLADRSTVIASIGGPSIGLVFSLIAALAAVRLLRGPDDKEWHVAACSALGCYLPMAILQTMSLSTTILQTMPEHAGGSVLKAALLYVWFVSLLGCMGTVWIGLASLPVLIGSLIYIGVRHMTQHRRQDRS